MSVPREGATIIIIIYQSFHSLPLERRARSGPHNSKTSRSYLARIIALVNGMANPHQHQIQLFNIKEKSSRCEVNMQFPF